MRLISSEPNSLIRATLTTNSVEDLESPPNPRPRSG